jgi:hypothetical protein
MRDIARGMKPLKIKVREAREALSLHGRTLKVSRVQGMPSKGSPAYMGPACLACLACLVVQRLNASRDASRMPRMPRALSPFTSARKVNRERWRESRTGRHSAHCAPRQARFAPDPVGQ